MLFFNILGWEKIVLSGLIYVTNIVDTEHNFHTHIYSITSPFFKVMFFKAHTYNKTMLCEVNALWNMEQVGLWEPKTHET